MRKLELNFPQTKPEHWKPHQKLCFLRRYGGLAVLMLAQADRNRSQARQRWVKNAHIFWVAT